MIDPIIPITLYAADLNIDLDGPLVPPEIQGFIAGTLLLVGASFCLLASIGVIRMPDVYTRMQAATKAGTLGVACIILGVAAHFGSLGTAAESLLIVAFLFLTAPVASHLIARAAYFVDVPKWKDMEIDEMEACYDDETHELDAPPSFTGKSRPEPRRRQGKQPTDKPSRSISSDGPQWVEE